MKSKSKAGISLHQRKQLVESLRLSANPYERDALFFGTVAADGSPILVDRQQLRQHAHVLGGTGGGKSAIGLAPLVEQLISFGDSTVIIIDLKGDSNELLAAADYARKAQELRTGQAMPLKHFTIENGKATCIFNPLCSEGWLGLTHLQRTDVIAAACGLAYGSDYGRAFFSSANSAVIYAAEQLRPHQRNFSGLLTDVSNLILGRNGNELPQELRRAGVHAFEVLSRLASITQLNVSAKNVDAAGVIDLADCFRTPQILYFKLSSSISQDTSAAVGRLVAYNLMTASHQIQGRQQVYLVIDEFQRMAAESLSILFEQARSLDISLILSNQSVDDLGKHKSSLLNVIDTNCNTRQWFSLPTKNDVSMVEAISCLREREEVSSSVSQGPNGQSKTESTRVSHVPRISALDAAYISNDENLSVLRLTGVRRGYSQYRGLPFVVRSGFHITEEEYEKRRAYPWPEIGDGMIASSEQAPPSLAETRKKRAASVFPKPEDKPEVQSSLEFSDWTPDGF